MENTTLASCRSKPFQKVILVATLLLLSKLSLSFFTFGTNDVTYWLRFTDIIQHHGTVKLYAMDKVFNHPPLLSWILPLISALAQWTGLTFSFVFRLMPIFSDYFCVFILWSLLEHYRMRTRMLICLLAAVNPLNFFVSGFHGNTDTIFSFLIIYSIYWAQRNQTVVSGLVYGLSMCIKIVPVILFPAMFFSYKTRQERMQFTMAASIIPACVFLPYLYADFHSVSSNIFGWGGLQGIWGIGHLLRSVFMDGTLSPETRKLFYDLFKLHINVFKPAFLATVVALSYYVSKKPLLNRLESVFLTYVLFLTFTPGFGVQYLSSISTLSVIISPLFGGLYTIAGGIFLYRVYTFWSGGFPMNFANSDVVGQWRGFDEVLDIFLWIIVCAMLLSFLMVKKILPLKVPAIAKAFPKE